MIPGDIDLTENLDFRKTVRRNIPILPWKDSMAHDYNFTDLTESDYNQIDNLLATELNNYTFSTNITIGNNTHTTTSSFTSVNYSSSSTTIDASYTIRFNPIDELEYDVFGNLIQPHKNISNNVLDTWNNGNRNNKPIPKIPWEYYTVPYHKSNNYIPWNNKSNGCSLVYHESRINIGKRICYLAGKTLEFIEDYFDKKDNSSYLTNMSHIRVRNAIIE